MAALQQQGSDVDPDSLARRLNALEALQSTGGPINATSGTINQTPVSYINTKGFGTPTRKVIIDTDWWTDVDDVLAMRMAFEFERLGVWDILGVAISTTLAAGPRSLDMLALFDGRPNLPIFIPTTSHVPSGTPPYQTNMLATTLPGSAASYLSSGSAGSLNVPGAVAGLTRLLQDATTPVEIVAIGYPNNLYELLLAQPALVAAKVSKLWMMAGLWPSGSENNFNRTAQTRTAGNYICANWPTPITFLGFEIGVNTITGGNLIQLSATDPVSKAIADYGLPYGRASWDPMMMLLAATGDVTRGGYTSVRGTASVNASTGANSFAAQATGPHEYVVRNVGDNYYVSTINDLVYPNSARKSFKYADGTSFYAPTLPRPNIGQNFVPVLGATTDVDSLLHHWSAQDNSDIADTATVATAYNRVRKAAATLASTGALQPVMATAGSKRAWKFSAAQVLTTPALAFPPEITVYASVFFSTSPSSNQTVVANEEDSSTKRSFQLKSAAAAAAQAVSINVSTATVDSANASAAATGAWHIMCLRRSTTQLEALFNGTTDGATTLSGGSGNTVAVALNVGARKSDASVEGVIGHIREVRIYGSVHTDAQVAAVSAEMA